MSEHVPGFILNMQTHKQITNFILLALAIPLTVCLFASPFQVVGNEHNTLIFDIKSPRANHQTEPLHISLFVCIAGDGAQREKFEFYVQETFR